MSLARALFAPRAIALVGASGDAAKNTARPQRYLKKHGYAGRVVPVNPTRDEVLGERAYPSVGDIPGEIDHAFVMAGGEAVERALEDCGARGVPVMSVYSDGFADAGAAGAARQAKLVARARELDVRVLGPNSMGVVNLPGRVALTVNAVLEMDAPPAGTTSIVSQSGTMLGTVLSRGAASGLGFAKLVSLGNEADLGAGEIVELLAADPDTRTILLFLETIRDAARLAAAARAAHAAGKPVVAYKLGRSALGERLARSHTGALAGADRAVDAFFRDCGIVRVDMLETLVEIAPLLAGRRPPRLARAPRVAVVTTTGGGAASVVDRLGLSGIETVAPGTDAPIVDLTMAATPQKYAATLDRLLASDECDAVLAVVGSSAQFHPQLAVEPILAARRTETPLAAFFTPHAEGSLKLLAQAGIAAFRTPEACADAFVAYFSWRAPRAALQLPQAAAVTLDIPMAKSEVARAPDYAHHVPYPVAVKVNQPGIEHKTEVGGVILGVRNREELLEAARSLPGEAVLVQKMESGLAEAIVGYRDDPMVGPVVLVGAGGVLAEIYRDTVLRMAPVSVEEAEEMIGEVKGLAVLRGYRNLPRGDLRAHAADYPWDVAKLMASQGLLGITAPEADGGQGGTLMDAAIAIETVASVCPRSADVVQAGNFGAIRVLAEYGTPLQKDKFLKRLLSGEAVISVGMSEPEAGSAVTDLATTAKPDGDGYIVNGSKVFTTHSAYADVYLAYVRFGPGVGGIGSVLIDTKAPGVRFGQRSKFMSGEDWAQVYFEDVRVPADMVVLKEGGFKKQIAGFNVERIGNTARSLALGRYAFEEARQWAMQRKQFGRLLCEFQGLQWKFADMKIKLDAGQLLLYRAAANADRGFPSAEETSIAKAFCNQAGFEVASEALQVMGGLGYSQESLVEYCMRRCRGWMIAGGSIEILKNRIAEGVFERSFSQRPGG